MNDEPIADEERAYRILDDRRSFRFLVTDDRGWVTLEVAASAAHPGYVAVREGGSDPVLLGPGAVAELAFMFTLVREGLLRYPETPRPCDNCGEVVHTPETCESALWDPTCF